MMVKGLFLPSVYTYVAQTFVICCYATIKLKVLFDPLLYHQQSRVSLILESSRLGIRNFKNKRCHELYMQSKMDVIGYGIVVLGTEQGNPNHPNIFMLQHLGNEE